MMGGAALGRSKKNRFESGVMSEYYGGLGSDTSDVFTKSLDSLSEDDLLAGTSGEGIKKKKKKKSAGGIISTLMFFVFAAVFAVCAWKIVGIVQQYRLGDEIYDAVAEEFDAVIAAAAEPQLVRLGKSGLDSPMQSYSDVLSNGAIIYNPDNAGRVSQSSVLYRQMLVKLEEWRDSNPDIYGYISIDGTNIRYPMVQSDDNDFYLTHSYTGKALKSGAIFVDYRNSRTISRNRNTVVYGHNMENGAMFHSMTKFLDRDFFMNTDIVIYAFDGIYTFEMFSIYETYATDDYFRVFFSGDDDFVSFCEREEGRSMYHRDGVKFGPDSVIVTFSTCINSVADGRYAIHALLKKFEN